jgi:hypothetical protein
MPSALRFIGWCELVLDTQAVTTRDNLVQALRFNAGSGEVIGHAWRADDNFGGSGLPHSAAFSFAEVF